MVGEVALQLDADSQPGVEGTVDLQFHIVKRWHVLSDLSLLLS